MAIATPRTWVVGEVVTAAMLNAEVRDQWTDLISGWTNYTPSWTATGTAPVLGNGSIFGRYKLVGKVCTVNLEAVFGTTSTFGSGAWGFSVPFTAASPASSSTNFSYLGAARGHNASQWVTGTVAVAKGFAVARLFSHQHSAEWAATQPQVWVGASTNYLEAQLSYETT
ncbi:hypothetical protein OG462_09045 [Streptomyces sp. NBC_01077]|uniref:hypothetical protein n=1 Tax=Streptomyces sp. NBC_01077 TaxID=2903746 RepID=UPI00386C216D|nr:hypothetical protein OG462_09045 [Streptomyces sp. NBC_01077]